MRAATVYNNKRDIADSQTASCEAGENVMAHWREKQHDRRDTASGVILRLHYLNRADGVFRMPDVDLIREMRLYYI